MGLEKEKGGDTEWPVSNMMGACKLEVLLGPWTGKRKVKGKDGERPDPEIQKGKERPL